MARFVHQVGLFIVRKNLGDPYGGSFARSVVVGGGVAGVGGLELNDDALHDRQAGGDLLEERWIVRNEAKIGMVGPQFAQSPVQLHGLSVGFDAGGVSGLDGEIADGGALKEDDRIVTFEFIFQGGAHLCKEVAFVVRPVDSPIDGAAVA